jgi:hypothetical protein
VFQGDWDYKYLAEKSQFPAGLWMINAFSRGILLAQIPRSGTKTAISTFFPPNHGPNCKILSLVPLD